MRYLAKLGGATVADAVRRIMPCLMTDDVAKQLNWCGIRGKDWREGYATDISCSK